MYKLKTWFAGLAALAFATTAACSDDSGLTGDPMPDAGQEPDAPPGVKIVNVPAGDISTDTTWTKDNIYVLKGYVFFTGGTLTIEAGTTIKGDNGSALTITKDAKLIAQGTASEPIVFTSSSDNPRAGDWGGLVLLGKASINVAGGVEDIDGFPSSYGDRIVFGGGASPNDDHDCGTLKYVRVEYAGFELSPGSELNGITLGGCGRQTVVDYIQSHMGLDDGVEIFGGTVDIRHVVITQPDDDGLDWDLGWRGTAQFVIVQQREGLGDKAFESDNHPTVYSSTPRSAPELWNVTLIGGDGPAAQKRQGGMHLRHGTAGTINNAIIAYFNGFAVDIDGADSAALYGTELSVKNTYFVKSTNATAVWPANFDVSNGNENDCQTGPNTNCLDEATVIGQDPTNHVDVDVKLGAPKDLTAPDWKPASDSPVLTGCGTPPAGFDTTATFCGAIGSTDWTAGWTKFPE